MSYAPVQWQVGQGGIGMRSWAYRSSRVHLVDATDLPDEYRQRQVALSQRRTLCGISPPRPSKLEASPGTHPDDKKCKRCQRAAKRLD